MRSYISKLIGMGLFMGALAPMACENVDEPNSEMEPMGAVGCQDPLTQEQKERYIEINELLKYSQEAREIAGLAHVSACSDIESVEPLYDLLKDMTRTLADYEVVGSTVPESELSFEPVTDAEASALLKYDSEGNSGIRVPRIWKGIDSRGRRGVAKIMVQNSATDTGNRSMCTAILLNRNWILTAAHCIHDQGSTIGLKVTYRYDAEDYCATSTSSLPSTCGSFVTASAYTDPDYPSDATGDDIGLIYYGADLTLPTSSFGARLYDDDIRECGRNLHYGYGHTDGVNCTGAGTLRYGWLDKDWNGPAHWYGNADNDYRVCAGDSGGPGIKVDGSYDMHIGLASNTYFGEHGCCAKVEAAQRFVRIAPHISWITEKTGITPNRYLSPSGLRYATFY